MVVDMYFRKDDPWPLHLLCGRDHQRRAADRYLPRLVGAATVEGGPVASSSFWSAVTATVIMSPIPLAGGTADPG